MVLIDKETIRKEIERKQRIARYQWRPQSEQLCQELLDWLDTLLEQSVEGLEEEIDRFCESMWESLPNFEHSDGDAVISVVKNAARHFFELGQQSRLKISEDLNFQTFAKEMDELWSLPSEETKNDEDNPLRWEYAIARHFAEWGAEHLKK